MKFTFKKFKEKIYGVEVWLVYDISAEDFKKFLEQKRIKVAKSEIINDTTAMCFEIQEAKDNTYFYIIWLEKGKDFYSLVHECIHLVKHIFVNRGIKFDANNDEQIAYYHEYWVKQFWHAIGKK